MKQFLISLFSIFVMTGCSSLKVNTDYDPDIMMQTYQSFFILQPSDDQPDTLTNERIVKAVSEHLQSKGYQPASKSEADFHVRYGTEVQEDVPSNFSFGFGIGMFSGHTGTSIGAAKRPLSNKGTLIIDMLSPSDHKTLWRGMARDTLKKNDTPQEREANIRHLVDSLLESFPKREIQ